MMPKPLSRTFTSIGLSAALLGLLLAMPVATFGATPNWSGALVALPPILSPLDDAGDPSAAGYRATITNSGPSNISQLSVSVAFSQPYDADAEGGDAPVFVLLTKDGVELDPATACGEDVGTTALECSVGALGANQSASVTVAYMTDGSDDDAGVTVRWTSVGQAGDPGDNSRGDVLSQTVATQMSDDATDYAGQFLLDGGTGTVIDTAPINGAANQAQTRVHSPAQYIAVSVEDGLDPTCPEGYTGCVLEASEIHVGEGAIFEDLFKVEVIFDKTILSGVNFKKLTILHELDNGDVVEISQSKFCDGTTVCGMSQNLQGGHALFTMYFDQNGYIKYH